MRSRRVRLPSRPPRQTSAVPPPLANLAPRPPRAPRSSRPTTSTAAPACPNLTAAARPMPLDAPSRSPVEPCRLLNTAGRPDADCHPDLRTQSLSLNEHTPRAGSTETHEKAPKNRERADVLGRQVFCPVSAGYGPMVMQSTLIARGVHGARNRARRGRHRGGCRGAARLGLVTTIDGRVRRRRRSRARGAAAAGPSHRTRGTSTAVRAAAARHAAPRLPLTVSDRAARDRVRHRAMSPRLARPAEQAYRPAADPTRLVFLVRRDPAAAAAAAGCGSRARPAGATRGQAGPEESDSGRARRTASPSRNRRRPKPPPPPQIQPAPAPAEPPPPIARPEPVPPVVAPVASGVGGQA